MFNGAQLHLLLNHLPVLLPFAGIALVLVGLFPRFAAYREAGAALLVFSALMAIPAYLTGEPAESVVKNYPDASRLLIHDHEHFAFKSLWVLEGAGALALVLLYGSLLKKNFSKRLAPWFALIALSLVSFGLMGWTAHLGGLIRHEEVRATDRF